MKIKVEFDLTPEEFRESLGLPNISGLQDEALSFLKSRVSSDLDDVDMARVVESWFSQGIAASRKIQEIVASAASDFLDPDSGSAEESPRKAKRKKKKK